MKIDYLSLFNTRLVATIVSKNDGDLWDFLMAHEERVKQLFDNDQYPKTSALFAYPHGIKRFKEYFLQHVEEDREGMIYTLVLDFCLSREWINLDYRGQGGFLDNADSCGVKTSDDVMPPVDEDSDAGCRARYFHLLDPHHVQNIIDAIEKNFDKLTDSTRENIDQIKQMKKFCLQNDGYNAVYIYGN